MPNRNEFSTLMNISLAEKVRFELDKPKKNIDNKIGCCDLTKD